MHGREGVAAPRTGLALTAVDLQRHRHLVRDRLRDHRLVMVDGIAQDVKGRAEALHLFRLEVRALSKRAEPGLPQDLVDPRAPDARDQALVAQQGGERAGVGSRGWSWPGRAISRAVPAGRGAGQASGPRVATISSVWTASRGMSFA